MAILQTIYGSGTPYTLPYPTDAYISYNPVVFNSTQQIGITLLSPVKTKRVLQTRVVVDLIEYFQGYQQVCLKLRKTSGIAGTDTAPADYKHSITVWVIPIPTSEPLTQTLAVINLPTIVVTTVEKPQIIQLWAGLTNQAAQNGIGGIRIREACIIVRDT